MLSFIITTNKDILIYFDPQFLTLTFNQHTGLLKTIENRVSHIKTQLKQDILYYEAMQGGARSSGAYVFVPQISSPRRVSADFSMKVKVVKVS